MLVGSPLASSNRGIWVMPPIDIPTPLPKEISWLCTILPSRLFADEMLYPGTLVGSQPSLHAPLCVIGHNWPLLAESPGGSTATSGAAAAITITPLKLSRPSVPVMPQLPVRLCSTENVSMPAGLIGQPQHSPISSSSSNT